MQAMTLRLPDDVHRALMLERIETGKSMQQIILELIEQHITPESPFRTEGLPPGTPYRIERIGFRDGGE